jgi:hypothetical protein
MNLNILKMLYIGPHVMVILIFWIGLKHPIMNLNNVINRASENKHMDVLEWFKISDYKNIIKK